MKASAAPIQRTKQIASHLIGTMTPPATAASTGPAPWRAAFLSHVEGMDSPNFVLSTLHAAPPAQTGGSPAIPFVARARTVVFRGMWASLPANSKNQAERNPEVYESDLLTITTDARMEKVPELFGSAESTATAADPQSRPAGPVEAVFWMPKYMTQWRIRGHAVVIGPDIESDAGKPARESLAARLRSNDDKGDAPTSTTSAAWSWARELTAHFGNLSPIMRGSFRNPPPGTPRDDGSPGGGSPPKLGQRVDDLQDEVARRHFRVVAVVPEEVDRVDLSDPEDGRRWNYKYDADDEEGGGSWTTTELWP